MSATACSKCSILEIRRALGDDPASPRFIETVPRRGYRFIAPRSGSAREARRRRMRAGVLVGRDEMLAQLEQRLERARTGALSSAFLSGEAGIGKTTVLDAFLARVAPIRTSPIATGACLEHYGAAEAYLPVLEALAGCCASPAPSG